jgi:predicted metallopeptidase
VEERRSRPPRGRRGQETPRRAALRGRRTIRYEPAPDIQARFADIVRTLGLNHIDLDKVVCIRSRGSSARRIIARCHGMSKVLQVAMGIKAFYVLEFISERFDRLSAIEQIRTIIHELMHIPKNFGGGFRYHDHVTARNVQAMLEAYLRAKTS